MSRFPTFAPQHHGPTLQSTLGVSVGIVATKGKRDGWYWPVSAARDYAEAAARVAIRIEEAWAAAPRN